MNFVIVVASRNVSVYLGNQRNLANADVISTHGTMLELVQKLEAVGQKIFMDNSAF
jgi:hypothetical protein